VLGVLTFWLPWSRQALGWLNDVLIAILNVYQKGNIFLFGPLAIGPGQTLPDGTASIGFVLALQVLPAVIFFSAVVAGLYYLKIMPAIVRGFAWLFYRVMRISGAESLSASANIFVGIESSLTIRPYLATLTSSELLTVLTCMMATVASTVMAIYVIALQGVFPEIAGHLVSASIISIPCAILISKLTLPEDQQPETLGDLPSNVEEFDSSESEPPSNLIAALIDGGMQGVKMAVGIAALLIVFLGLEAMVDLVLALLPQMGEAPLSLNRILGWATWPFTVLMGLRPEEWQTASQILGARFVETEVAAYFELAAVQSAALPALTPRSLIVMTYALCGFVHVASVGIFVGGLSALIPSRVQDISRLGFRALWTAFLATVLTGCIAGVLA
jgi:concentrative nucleoside transporter, CNT family